MMVRRGRDLTSEDAQVVRGVDKHEWQYDDAPP
jgi:hypothetical protein